MIQSASAMLRRALTPFIFCCLRRRFPRVRVQISAFGGLNWCCDQTGSFPPKSARARVRVCVRVCGLACFRLSLAPSRPRRACVRLQFSLAWLGLAFYHRAHTICVACVLTTRARASALRVVCSAVGDCIGVGPTRVAPPRSNPRDVRAHAPT